MNIRALFIYTHFSTFVRGDANILGRKYNVSHLKVDNKSGISLIISLIKQLFYLLFNIRKYRFVYIWFADYHSFIPALMCRIFGVPLFLVIGGYDICREKKLNYGSFTNPVRAFCSLFSIKNATVNLCVSQNIERVIKKIAPVSKTKLLYNGITLEENLSNIEKEIKYDFLCVALVSTIKAFYIKGIDRFNQLAKYMPDKKFILIGCSQDIFSLCGITPSENLTLLPKMEHKNLTGYYLSSHVYCQLSRRESFSLSLAEAMYYNCIPLITNTGGMPEVTSHLGYIADGNTPRNLLEMAEKAHMQKSSSIYSERIKDKFTIAHREAGLNKIIDLHLNSGTKNKKRPA